MTGLEGFAEAMKAMDRLVEVGTAKMEDVLEYALREMCNYAKQNGPFEDHTANLRNSIGINFAEMKSWQASEAEIVELKALRKEMETPVLEYEATNVWGYLYAGMEYAIYVERLDGFWVLEGAINFYEPQLQRMFKSKLTFRRSDLL